MLPLDPPMQRTDTLAEKKVVPLPIPMQLVWFGVPNIVPFCVLYVCQPPYELPLVPASVVHVRPCIVVAPVMFAPPVLTVKAPPEVRFPPMPAFPPVESVVLVKLPVTLLVPTIDSPPLVFEIAPLEFTCVQDRYPTVELPVTLSPLVEVRPAEVIVPAMLAFPEETVKPPDVLTPLHTRAFVVSKPMPNLPAYCPEL